MQKVGLAILLLMVVTFFIPILFTTRKPIQEVGAKVETTQEQPNSISTLESTYSSGEYQTIKLLHTKTNEVEEVNLEEYLYHVVSAEMPADFELEALKAQAVVARTYTVYKMATNQKKHGEADICDSAACCQAWISKEDRLARWEESIRQSNWDKIVNAVNSTQRKIITYDKKPINAFFHSNSGGKTEQPFNVWGGSGYPYLQAVETMGEEGYSQYYSEVELSKQELEEKIRQKHPELQIDYLQENWLEIKERTDGNRVKTLKVGNLELAGVEIRTILGLRSANFTVVVEDDKIKFSVIGYGHGVGMSQTGADALAKQGQNYEAIIHHFYTGVEIKDME